MNRLTLPQRLMLVVGLALLLALMGASLFQSVRVGWADANSLGARWLVSEWRESRGPGFTPERWQQARDVLTSTLSITPDNPQLYDDLGFLHASRAQLLGYGEPGSPLRIYQEKLLEESIVHYRQATVLRPTFPFSWAYLAMAKDLRGQDDAELWLAFDKALRFGYTESAVRIVLTHIACAHWDELSPQRKQGIIHMVEVAPLKARGKLLDIGYDKGIVLVPRLRAG
jgi:hypothetical protein